MPLPRLAVILAAGRGTRLGERGLLMPKGFLQLGTQTIIAESIERLLAAGIEQIILVTGHCAEHYTALASHYPGRVSTLFNPRHADSGSLYSLSLIRDRVNEDFLLLESDLIYEQQALSQLATAPEADVILLSGATQSGDEVYVEAPENRLLNMAKNRALLGPAIAGELVGISRLSARLLKKILCCADELFLSTYHVEYEQGLVAAAKEHPIACLKIEDLAWSEIDTEEHLARARESIYPRIVARDKAHECR